ncbi:MAG: N-acetylmuramic acid 6-phosphate etherase [Erysipelotrichaceae bacterium]|nr:N-acetylmuramic acid 6-phosphate etherase [Erysipelotrichaceae bacterium]
MSSELNSLLTEQQNPDTVHIDEMDTGGILRAINNEDKKVAMAVEKALPQIAKVCDAVYKAILSGGRLIYLGAGTSGRLGVLDASECPPTFGVDQSLVQGIIAGGVRALYEAKEGAEDKPELAVADLKAIKLGPNDFLLGLAASGRTPYVAGGLEYARSIGAQTGSICCVENGLISQYATFPIEVLTGPETVTGSTRMKAGTAQKMVLNMISTTAMIKIGKIYRNLMVDVKPTNAKLVERAITIIQESTGVCYERAKSLLALADNQVKIAVLMGLTGSDVEQCNGLLRRSGENISKAIKSLKE